METAFGDLAGRFRGQDSVEWCPPDAGGARVIRAGGNQNRAAIAHVFRDVVEIDQGQHALPCVPVENDQLEFRDLLLEQLAGRKGDQ